MREILAVISDCRRPVRTPETKPWRLLAPLRGRSSRFRPDRWKRETGKWPLIGAVSVSHPKSAHGAPFQVVPFGSDGRNQCASQTYPQALFSQPRTPRRRARDVQSPAHRQNAHSLRWICASGAFGVTLRVSDAPATGTDHARHHHRESPSEADGPLAGNERRHAPAWRRRPVHVGAPRSRRDGRAHRGPRRR